MPRKLPYDIIRIAIIEMIRTMQWPIRSGQGAELRKCWHGRGAADHRLDCCGAHAAGQQRDRGAPALFRR
jgi:hypothetical protein